jgi:dTDP-4-amino-4,6-dideoxygalactose transaminase
MLGIGSGDEVITTACSWISTAETISQTGARPVFVNIEPDLFTIDATLIEAAITPHTKAIIPVPLYG